MSRDPLEALAAGGPESKDPLEELAARTDLPADYEERKKRVQANQNTEQAQEQLLNLPKATAEQALALGTGAAERLPGGKLVQDALVAALPGKASKNAKLVEEAKKGHETAADVGNIAGDIGSLGAGGALGLGGKAAVAAGAAIGAANVAAAQVGETIHQDQMEARPITSEHLWQSLDWGMLGLGAIVGGGAQAVAPAINRGVTRLMEEAKPTVERFAQRATEKLVDRDLLGKTAAKALKKTGATMEELTSRIRGEGIFTRGAAEARTAKAGEEIGEAIKDLTHGPELTNTMENINNIASNAAEAAKQGVGNADQQEVANFLQKEFAQLNAPDGSISTPQAFYQVAQKLGKEGIKYNKTLAEPIWSARQAILDGMDELVKAQKPEISGEFTAKLQDYRIYMNLESVLKNDLSQVTAAELKTKAAMMAGKAAVGAAAGSGFGHAGELAGAVAASAAGGAQEARALGNRSFAQFLDQMSKGPATQAWIKTNGTIDKLLKGAGATGATLLGHLSADEIDQAYQDAKGHLESVAADPMAHAQDVQENLNRANMPAQVADAATTHIMDKTSELYNQIPKSTAPAALFGAEDGHITTQQKRDFLRKLVCAKDPHAALLSGNPALIKYAEQFNPETIAQFRQELVKRLNAPGAKIDYRVKSQLAGCLGGAALGSQDPRIGAGFQANITDQNFQQSQEGHMASARQNRALNSAQKGMVTKSQALGAAADAQTKEEQGR